MVKVREHRTAWLIAAGVAALAVVIAVVWGASAMPGTSSAPMNAAPGATSAEGTSLPDAATTGLDDDTAMQEQEVTEYVPNEVLVNIEDPALLETLVPGAELAGGTIVSVEKVTESDDGTGVVKVTFEGDATEDDVVSALGKMGASAQKNFVYHLM